MQQLQITSYQQNAILQRKLSNDRSEIVQKYLVACAMKCIEKHQRVM